MKQNYKIVLQYEGTRYQGWQRQTSTDNTLQGKLEQILSKMCNESVEVQGAGRTDAGVHAKGQTASFVIDTEKTNAAIMEYLNRYLPEDVAVISIEKMPERFHARLSATGKHYQYRVRNSCIPDVFSRKYVYTLPEYLDISAMQQAAEILSGTHDFKAFTSNHRTKKSTVRTIQIQINRKDEEIIFDFTGDGFLYHMVRILMGTLLSVGRHKAEPKEVKVILNQKERMAAGELVPACGLTLMEVFYEKSKK